MKVAAIEGVFEYLPVFKTSEDTRTYNIFSRIRFMKCSFVTGETTIGGQKKKKLDIVVYIIYGFNTCPREF